MVALSGILGRSRARLVPSFPRRRRRRFEGIGGEGSIRSSSHRRERKSGRLIFHAVAKVCGKKGEEIAKKREEGVGERKEGVDGRGE